MYNFNEFKNQLKDAEAWLSKEFSGLRTGRATPAFLDGITVDSYGSKVGLVTLGSIAVEDARTIRIVPWDHTQIQAIEKAIQTSNLGLSPVVDDKGIRVMFPELSAERRTSLLKVAKDKLEDTKVRIRLERDKVIKEILAKEKEGGLGKDEIQRFKNDVEKMMKEVTAKLEEHLVKKEKEIQS